MAAQPLEPLPAIRLKQYDTEIYLTKFPAEFLVELFRQRYLNVEKYQMGEEDSYQRFEDKKRIKDLADFIVGYKGDDLVKPILPSAIVINVRDPRDVKYENGELTIKRGAKLNIVDGQHRAKALSEAQSRGENLNYEIPVSVITNLERFQEAAQFLIINVKQKQVRTDLTLTVLHELEQQRTGDFVEKLKKALKVDAWQLAATTLAISMNDDRDSPWHDMIIRPNEERRQLKEAGRKWTPIRQASFVDSLRRFAEKDYPDITSKVAFLKKYWRNIKNHYGEAFDIDTGKNYVLLNGAGVGPIHILASLVYSLDKERMGTVEDSVNEMKRRFGPKFWERQRAEAGRWGTSQAEFAKNARQIAETIFPQLFDFFDSSKLDEYKDDEVLEEDDNLIELVERMFNPFNLQPIENLTSEVGSIQTPGCYLLVSGTLNRIRVYAGQSEKIKERIEDHNRPVRLYSFVEIGSDELDRLESLCYHLIKPNYRINDRHPPLTPCPFCD